MTNRTYGNMLNQKPVSKKPLKEDKGTSLWAKMLAKQGGK